MLPFVRRAGVSSGMCIAVPTTEASRAKIIFRGKGVFGALDEIGYEGWCVLEAFGRSLPGLAAATKIWRDMFSDPLDVARKGIPFMKMMMK